MAGLAGAFIWTIYVTNVTFYCVGRVGLMVKEIVIREWRRDGT